MNSTMNFLPEDIENIINNYKQQLEIEERKLEIKEHKKNFIYCLDIIEKNDNIWCCNGCNKLFHSEVNHNYGYDTTDGYSLNNVCEKCLEKYWDWCEINDGYFFKEFGCNCDECDGEGKEIEEEEEEEEESSECNCYQCYGENSNY